MELKKKMRLLVVEGEAEFKEQLTECIELCRHQYDIECHFTTSEGEAKKLLREFEPAVVLVDINLPESDTFQIIKGCSELEVPVVATSDFRTREVEEQAISSGATALIQRSNDPEEMELLLHHLASFAESNVGRSLIC